MMSVDTAGNPPEHMLTIVRNAGYRLVACPLAGVRSSRLGPWEHDSNMLKPVFGLSMLCLWRLDLQVVIGLGVAQAAPRRLR